MEKIQDNNMSLIQAFKKAANKFDPVEGGRRGYKQLVELALSDYVAATRMANDFCLPTCLSAFAKEITRTDGVPFRPKLRALVSELLDDRELCRNLLYLLESGRVDIDCEVRNILLPMVKTLASNLSPDSIGEKRDIQRR